MKKIDQLLVTSFIPPFLVTFFIAVFVLIMQYLWVYIDDIIGKGAGILMISEFIFYLSISLFPMALPIAVLVSSVMIMGNLAERYELASMKSAGISLSRIMLPLVFCCFAVSIFSYLCSNYIIPVSNLKFKSRLYDIRNQKPVMSLEEGVFNDDFNGFAIRIGEKGADNRSIKNVLIADHTASNKGRVTEIVANEGEMYITDNKRFMVMELRDGQQYQEGVRSSGQKGSKYPFMRTNFKEYTKIFDMSEFNINRTDEDLFKSHQTMLSAAQLDLAIDSIYIKIEEKRKSHQDYVGKYFYYLDTVTVKKKPKKEKKTTATVVPDSNKLPKDTAKKNIITTKKVTPKKKVKTPTKAPKIKKEKKKNTKSKKKKKKVAGKTKQKKNKAQKQFGKSAIIDQKIDKDLREYTSIIETFPAHKHTDLHDKAKASARAIINHAKSSHSTLNKTKEKLVKHIYELQSKFTFAVVCIIFLFIGAPMGAIVRKGGFGYPLLIAIIFFMIYIVLTMTFKKLAESSVLPAYLASWMPNLILFPIGIFLTYRAMNDSKIINLDRFTALFHRLLKKKKD